MLIDAAKLRLLCKEGLFVLAGDDWSPVSKFDDHSNAVATHATVAFCDNDGNATGMALQYVRVESAGYGSMPLPSVEQAALLHAHRIRCNLEGFTQGEAKYRIYLKGSQFNGSVNGSKVLSLKAVF